jgi:hypothetical protein
MFLRLPLFVVKKCGFALTGRELKEWARSVNLLLALGSRDEDLARSFAGKFVEKGSIIFKKEL